MLKQHTILFIKNEDVSFFLIHPRLFFAPVERAIGELA